MGTGRADVLDLSGRRLASFDAFDLAWVDDSHLVTGTATWSATGACFIATGTYDAQVEDDHLLRIELPQG